MHLLSNVLISKEKSNAEVFGSNVLTVPNDQFADSSEHDVFDGLRCDAAQVRYEDRGISHPAIRSMSLPHVIDRSRNKRRVWKPRGGGERSNGPLLGFQSPQTDLAVIQGCLILGEGLSRVPNTDSISRPSVISTTGADFKPGSSGDITVQGSAEGMAGGRMRALCHKRTPEVAVIVTHDDSNSWCDVSLI